jgi:hypothetical protein
MKIMRPQFDHWFPKSKYPLLALSFYNLIPSCSVCNSSAKGDATFLLDTHLHPYIDSDSLKKFSFTYGTGKGMRQYDIEINQLSSDLKAVTTFNDMNLKEMYNAHQSELDDLIITKNNFSDTYINDVIKSFPLSKLTPIEAYRILFGTEYSEEDFHKRPFSKFKSDILKQLKIIT